MEAARCVVERPVLRLERPRQRQVQLGALARQEVVVDGLAQQRVAEHVAVALGDDDVARDRLAQPVAQRARLHAR